MNNDSSLIVAFPWPAGTDFPRRPPGFASVGRRWHGLDPDGLAHLIGDIFEDAQPDEPVLRLSVAPYVYNARDPNWIPRVDVEVYELTDVAFPTKSFANTLLPDYLRDVIRDERKADRSYDTRILTFSRDGWFWVGTGSTSLRRR